MRKICTEVYYQLNDGRKVFVKTIHETGQEIWYVKEVDSAHYYQASKEEMRDLKLKASDTQ